MGYENIAHEVESNSNHDTLDFARVFDAMGNLPEDVRRSGPGMAKSAMEYAKDHPVEAGALVIGGAVTAIGVAEFSGALMAVGLMCELGTLGYLGVQEIKKNFGSGSTSHGVPTVTFDRGTVQQNKRP
jgi:uncharacterized membrane protein YebE (DUF533 family)